MYLDYYGFTEKPFSITPNPRFIFFSTIHKEAFALLLYGIDKRFGFIELIGEVGTGKTTVLRTLLSQLNEENYRTALIFNPSLSAIDLMRAVNREFGIPAGSGNAAELVEELNQFLFREHAIGRTVVLVIDEAQNLAPEVLEQVRLISNLETDADKLIQIILAGQPELGRLLEKPELRQINQRIALRYYLKPLDRNDTGRYVEHRLGIAGSSGKVSFSPAALWWLYRCSRGTPRLINMLCDRALLIGYTENSRRITGRIATLAFKDIMLKPARPLSRRSLAAIAAIAAVALLAAGYPLLSRQTVSGKKAGSSTVTAPLDLKGKPAAPTASPEAVPAGTDDFRKALGADLSVRSETKSALAAFNELAALWHAPPVRNFSENGPVIRDVRKQAGSRGLIITPFKGTVDELLRLDSPALLAIAAKKGGQSFLVALTGLKDGKLLISPPLLGRTAFAREELAPLWSSHAYLVWRNSDNIDLPVTPGTTGKNTRKIQELLRRAGYRDLGATGVYGGKTVHAVKDFQSSRGVKETGVVGALTLIHLYKAVNGPLTPSLTNTRKTDRL